MNDFFGFVGLAVLIAIIALVGRSCRSDMDAEHCITVCNARVESYDGLTQRCECKP